MATTVIRGANSGVGVSQIKAGTIGNADITIYADLSMASHNLTNVLDPVNNQDAATKAWVLANATGAVPPAATVRVATTAAGTLASSFENGDVVDGITLATSDRILIKNQSAAAENGLYTVNASGAPTRTTDFDAWNEIPGKLITVQVGTTNANTMWLSTADLGGTLNTTSISFIQLPGPSDILAGAGLTRTGQTMNVIAGDASIVANADEIHVGTITDTQLGAGIYLKVANKITRETPSGSINSSNTAFTLANTPVSGSEEVFLNGILQEPGAGNDYTISGSTITYLNAPTTGDRLRVSYMK